ncbi:hypothetical protein DFH28DRAFT_1077763 [Melampsora americana]|nr:hypothetical protein DFH28DRAFT_1077763 [Melampsora americana]
MSLIWKVVQLAPGDFHTVREVEENGWALHPRGPISTPALPPLPVTQARRVDDPVATGTPGRRDLKRPADGRGDLEPSSKRVARSFASTTDRALPDANLIKITEIDQCPDFWAMPMHALKQWKESVVILDRTILGYFQHALKEAEADLARAASGKAARNQATPISLGHPSSSESGRKRATPAIRSVKEEPSAPTSSHSTAFKFNVNGPNCLDLIYMRALDALSPFGAKGQKGKVFHECAIWLKNDVGTRKYFATLSESPNSRVLQVRYTQLKTWLAAAEGWSKMDSGTKEDDEELRQLIRSVQDEEETSRALRLAGQEEREAVKSRSLLAEAVREQYADKAVQDLDAAGGDGDDVTWSSSSSRKLKRSSSSIANASSDDLSGLTIELGRWNELYERELGIAHERNKTDRMMAQSLAAHRTAELALQQQRLEFKKSQVITSHTPLDNASTQKLDTLEVQMGSMNESLAAIMKHLGALVPPLPILRSSPL